MTDCVPCSRTSCLCASKHIGGKKINQVVCVLRIIAKKYEHDIVKLGITCMKSVNSFFS